jgi:hypothetical protein
MSPLLAQIVASLEQTNRLRGELATKAAILRDAATALRIGVAPEMVSSRLGTQLRALHGLHETETQKSG